jgi:peptidoglycan/LPS O-acetylase OafA/YrhL
LLSSFDGSNSFHHLRLVAAGMVVFSHSFRVFGLGPDPVSRILPPGQDLSTIGVMIFFGVSGYLITQSAMRSDPWMFVRNRALRILPGLVACVVLTAFALGALGSTLPYADYVAHPRTWLYLLNIPLFALQATLPNAFTGNPWTNHVNGSLWTLAIEASAYAAVFWGAFVMRKLRFAIYGGMVVNALLFFVFSAEQVSDVLSIRVSGDVFLFYLNMLGLSYLLFAFFVGAVLNWVRVFDLRAVAVLLAAALLAQHMLLLGAAVAYGAVAIGRRPAPYRIRNDLSYGIYLYHLPVLQLTWLYLHDRCPTPVMIAAGLGVVAAAAYLSWTLVEGPFIALRNLRRASVNSAPSAV